MISPMRKVTVLCLAEARQSALVALRELGVLHIDCAAAPAGAAAASGDTAAQRDAARHAVQILGALHPLHGMPADAAAPAELPRNPAQVVARTKALHTREAVLEEQIEDLQFELEAQAPFGDFDPDQARDLAARGLFKGLFRLTARNAFPTRDDLVRLTTLGGYHYGAAFGSEPLGEGLEPLPLPQRSSRALREEKRRLQDERLRVNIELHALAELSGLLQTRAEELDEQYRFERVRETLGEHGALVSLEGFCPTARMPMLQQTARRQGWGLWVRDPDPSDNVPVLLSLPRWLRPITVLFNGLGILPGYREADVSAVFLLFFSLFFAMLIGDAGYGALLLGGVLLARRLKPRAPAQPFWLFGVFGAATVLWGILTGNYFGATPSFLPQWLGGLPWLTADDQNVMWLCFLIGGVHLSIAHLWNALLLAPSRKALAEIGWVGVVWLMFFIAAQLVVGRPIPSFGPWVGGGGILLVALFMTDPREFKRDWINHPMLVLNLISCLVDVISYIRLFAVGMATAQIAMNFNQMAAGLPLPPWIKPLGMVLILALGHGLNLVLGALSILVHAVRLNTLEFSNHKGLTWSGRPYQPFRKPDAPSNA